MVVGAPPYGHIAMDVRSRSGGLIQPIEVLWLLAYLYRVQWGGGWGSGVRTKQWLRWGVRWGVGAMHVVP